MDPNVQCLGTTRSGHRCQMPRQRGLAYCVQHDPQHPEARRRNAQSGGEARKKQMATKRANILGEAFADLQTPDDVVKAIASTARALAAGDISARDAQALGGLLRALSEALGTAETERRLARVERALGPRRVA